MKAFKGKGLISDQHPLGCGVLGRSGTPIASWFMNEAERHEGRDLRPEVAERWRIWRQEKASRRKDDFHRGLGSAQLFHELSDLVPEDAILCVDVGNNTYSFGRYFENKHQSVLMSGSPSPETEVSDSTWPNSPPR